MSGRTRWPTPEGTRRNHGRVSDGQDWPLDDEFLNGDSRNVPPRVTAVAIGVAVGSLLVALGVGFALLSGNPPLAGASPTPPASEHPSPTADQPSPATPPVPVAPAACRAPGTTDTTLGTEPPSLIATRSTDARPQLTVDRVGCVHVALEVEESGGIVYLTDRDGSWTETSVETLPDECAGADRDLIDSISVDRDLAVWISFTRMSCGPAGRSAGSFHVTLRDGSWSAPVRMTGAGTRGLAFAVRDGRTHLVYEAGDELRYRTDGAGSPTDEQIGRRGGWAADMKLGADGQAHIVFLNNAVRYAVAGDGPIEVEKVADFHDAWSPVLALGPSDRPHAVWGEDWPRSSGVTVSYARRGQSWSNPIDAFGHDVEALGLTVDSSGVAHVFAGYDDGGLLHAVGLDGELSVRQIFDDWYATGAGAVAFDDLGLLHVLFVGVHDGETGMWHASGLPTAPPAVTPSGVSVAVDHEGTVNERGAATISGTITCRPAISDVRIWLQLIQLGGDVLHAFPRAGQCAEGRTPWQVEVTSEYYIPGDATVWVIEACAAGGLGECFSVRTNYEVILRFTGSATPTPTPLLPIPSPSATPVARLVEPILVYVGRRAEGDLEIYRLSVTNWHEYSAELFATDPSLPPCRVTQSGSRTWLAVVDATTGTPLAGECELYDPARLADSIFFVVEAGEPVPDAVYLEMVDQLTGQVVRSGPAAITQD